MRIPFCLRKARTTEPATGLLLLSEDSAELLSLCVHIGGGDGAAVPRLHAVSGGFLLRLARPVTTVFAGTIRLRQLVPDLFVPVDAELVPPLFPDEAAGLVRGRGLVFVPGGRVLEFDPAQPVPLSALLAVRRLERGTWRPFPERPPQPERLREVLLERPEESPDAVLASGGADIGVEQPEPPEPLSGSAAGAQVRKGLGHGLGWLGRLLGWKKLANMGGKMAQSAAEQLRKLKETVLDRQAAVLRDLLKQFQEGDLEKALRRALPLGEAGGRGGTLADNAQLPTHNPVWSLGAVVGGRGPATLWMGGADVQAQLAAEYRKAAEAATARGDFRRAAFIYARLLRDYRLAADVLSRGGLHHDAAVIYLEKLGDVLAAARAYEAAGEVDRAVQLYRQRGAHTLAGDLLRKAGEEEQALAEYLLAADQLRKTYQHYSAGELLLLKTGRLDLAEACFEEGWKQRPRTGAVPCLLRLAQLRAEHHAPLALLDLVGEAEPFFFAQSGSESEAASFYNELARLADRPNLAALRDQLRDRALLGLARKLRQRAGVEARAGSLVSNLFGQSGLWTSAQVSDAEAALKGSLQTRKATRTASATRPVTRLRIHDGTVSAACVAADTGRLFVAFEDGGFLCFQPDRSSSLVLPRSPYPVLALAADRQGDLLAALRQLPEGEVEIVSYLCLDHVSYTLQPGRTLHTESRLQLTQLVHEDHEPVVGVWDEQCVTILKGQQLVPWERVVVETSSGSSGVYGVLLVRTSPGAALVLSDRFALLCPSGLTGPVGASLNWSARPAVRSLSSQVFWTSQQGERLHVEVVRVRDNGGHLFWARLFLEGNQCGRQASANSKDGGYLAAAMVVPKQIAAVREGGIDFFRIQGQQLVVGATTEINLTGAAGCFFSPLTGEVLVVCRDGYLVRVPVPQ